MGQDKKAPTPVAPAVVSTMSAQPVQQEIGAGLDEALHALQGRFTFGISPIGPTRAWLDWASHMANSPASWLTLGHAALLNGLRLATALADPAGGPAITSPPEDHRFTHKGWSAWPFSAWSQGFLLAEGLAAQAATLPPGVETANVRMMAFGTRQLMDILSPSNLPWANPEVIEAARASGGANFVEGALHWLEDAQALWQHQPAAVSSLQVGHDLAVTAGKVVFRNELMELIQYAPSTPGVRPQPVLIVPAWIMKYYILDLSPQNSLIRWLVGQGFTVFAISWVNPRRDLAEVSLDDYRTDGVMAALDVVSDICGSAGIHACGYCLGGTLLSIAAAAMARDGDQRLASMTLLAAQTDFTEAGELQLFITEDQIAFLSDLMRARGYLESTQMAGAFQMLRTNDLVWSRAVRRYMLGAEEFPNDLMVWNADGTRMPARMHAEYLERLFHDNDLAEGRFEAGGKDVVLGDIQAPLFAVGTEADHIAPWRSVYKIGLLNDGDLTFVLTSGGHNAGIVSEPGHQHRHFRMGHRPRGGLHMSPETWQKVAPSVEGSWWPSWAAWLAQHSDGAGPPPAMGSDHYPALCDAPGTYVHSK